MAIFIPVGQTGEYHGSNGEKRVYSSFKKLPDSYCVFYSVKWGNERQGHYQKGEADFLVFDPARGFLVIEVKGGGIKRDRDGQWYSINRDSVEHPLKCSPLDQAWRSVDRFGALLEESPNAAVSNYKIIPTVWFPDIKGSEIRGKLSSEYQSSNTFTESDLFSPEAAINRAFSGNGIKGKAIAGSPKQLIEDVIKVFAPTFRIVPSISSELQERDFLFNQLTREQAGLLDYLVEQRTALQVFTVLVVLVKP